MVCLCNSLLLLLLGQSSGRSNHFPLRRVNTYDETGDTKVVSTLHARIGHAIVLGLYWYSGKRSNRVLISILYATCTNESSACNPAECIRTEWGGGFLHTFKQVPKQVRCFNESTTWIVQCKERLREINAIKRMQLCRTCVHYITTAVCTKIVQTFYARMSSCIEKIKEHEVDWVLARNRNACNCANRCTFLYKHLCKRPTMSKFVHANTARIKQ